MTAAADELNAAQRRAVEHDSGPLLVLAGPGTGKTRVITHRIAHLIEARGVEPEKIVALTFSVKAAGEMRERLAERCEPGVADRVNVHTLHGFGLRLLQRFGDMIGLRGQPELLDSARQRRLARELVAEHRLFPQMTFGKRDETLAWVESQAALLADHAVSSERARAFCAAWRARLGRGEGVQDAADARAQEEHLTDFAQLVEFRDHYDRARLERGWLSYSDYLSLPCRLLREHEHVRAIVRDDHRHWLVDEFQDTNTAQINLLALLAPPDANPDLCAVGDDDQGIYGFRGADDRAFEKFAAQWTKHTRVRLEENHRCRPAVIATANRVISAAAHRFDPGKLIRRPNPDPAAGEAEAAGSVMGVKLPHYRDDGEAIAAMILERRHRHAELSWKDFAVLARTHTDLARVAVALQIEGIPVRRVERESAPDDGVLDLLAWIRALVEPSDTLGVRRLLLRPPLLMSPDRVAALEQAYRAQRSRADPESPGAADPGGYVPWLQASAPHVPAVRALARLHGELAAGAATGRADETIFKIVCGTDLAHKELLSPSDRARRVAALVRAVRFARTRQTRLDEPRDLGAWWAYYNDLSANEQAFVEEHAADVSDTIGEDEEAADAVTLSTVHTAKGLEFDTVFVTRLQADRFPKVKVDPDRTLPEGLEDRAGDGRDPRTRALDEERRLFYVACTRAKRRLVLLAQRPQKPGKSANFFEELFPRPDGPQAGTLIEAREAIASAAHLGVGPGARTAESGLEGETPAGVASRSPDRLQVIAQIQREARVLAAGALQRADDPGLDAETLESLAATLRVAAERMALVASVAAGRAAPPWMSPEARATGAAMAARLAGTGGGTGRGTPCWAVLRPPLPLSYSFINDYLRCPRCFFVKRVLRMPEASSGAIDLGHAAHVALEEFFGRFQRADAEGTPPPVLADLLEAGKRAYYATVPRDQELDPHALTRLLDQLRVVFERLHNTADHILERERTYPFTYTHAGREHPFSAKIDRLDSLGDGRVRIIDYKTGKALKAYTEPAADDLQLGIYAMAVAHSLTLDPAELKGCAEYWALSTGQRGTLDLAALRLDKVGNAIDKAIDGVLKGEYPRGKKCIGECDILGPDATPTDGGGDD